MDEEEDVRTTFFNPQQELIGMFQITFIGAHKQDYVVIESVVTDANGHPLYLRGAGEAIYPWTAIIRMVRRS